MNYLGKIKPVALTEEKKLKTLVENRTAYTLERCELNIFETHTPSYLVPLTFNDLVITSMLRGKKIMHLFDQDGFDYLPGESVIVPAKVTMKIDFPEATDMNPTQCMGLAIDHHYINRTLNYLNEQFPKQSDKNGWSLDYDQFHFYNNDEIASLISKLIRICSSNEIGKDILADITLKELLVRIMQFQNLTNNNTDNPGISNANPLAYIIAYIKNNINEKILIEHLSDKACMSKANFYRVFKREFGISPLNFILNEKIVRAKQMLRHSGAKITSISDELGFTDVNYFIRLFKKMEGVTPASYRSNLLIKLSA